MASATGSRATTSPGMRPATSPVNIAASTAAPAARASSAMRPSEIAVKRPADGREIRRGQRRHGGERAHGERREHEPGNHPGSREHRGLGQELPDESPAPRADGQANGELPPAGSGPGEQQVRDVHTGNQQQHRHRDGQQDHRPSDHGVHAKLLQRVAGGAPGAPAFVRIGRVHDAGRRSPCRSSRPPRSRSALGARRRRTDASSRSGASTARAPP